MCHTCVQTGPIHDARTIRLYLHTQGKPVYIQCTCSRTRKLVPALCLFPIPPLKYPHS